MLESLVFAKRAACRIAEDYSEAEDIGEIVVGSEDYLDYEKKYKEAVLAAIERERKNHE